MANGTFKKSLGILIFFIAFSFNSFSQKKGNLKEFSNEFPVFLSELGDFMKSTENDKLKSVYNRFSKNAETLSVIEKLKIMDICNIMLSKRLKARPHFSEFLLAVISVKNSDRGDVLLINWLQVVFEMTEKTTTKKLLLFCKFTTNLVINNVLRSSRSATWKISNANFHFEFEMIEPIVVFDTLFNLTCFSDNGSYTIFDTKGKYYFVSTHWLGHNGVIDWESFSYSKDSVFAVIDSYKLDTRKSQVTADSVAFHHKSLFSEPILGRLVNKIVKGKQANLYPQFTSYSKNIELKEIFPNIDYRGGYKIKGKDFIADGGAYAEARIVFRRNNKEIFIANANKFTIGSDRIVAQNSGVRIFFDNDSIYHGNLQFKYIDSKRQLQLYRDVNGSSGAPMLNTYHNVTMDFELLEWDIDTDIITFGSLPGSAESRVEFESVDRYLQSKFESMQGIDAIHPLLLVNNYVRTKNEERFYVEDFVRFAKFPMFQIQHYLMQLANDGFVFYDFAENRITVLPKLYNYVNAASDLGDYDIISFNSIIKPGQYKTEDRYLVNAALNLQTKDLNMLGINEVSISKERGVYLFPKDGLIILKKNRDFVFNGQIFTGRGRLNLFGRKFFFHYDDFKVDLDNIDSLQLSVPVQSIQKDMYDTEVLTTVKTVIEAVRGELRIDHPNNKSGIRKDSFPQFPIFESFDDSYVYYDKKSIFNGVYDRNRFSFHLKPFKIDSLDNYTGKGLSFAGTFESAGIFPNFDDTLSLQKDYSLGFSRETPVNGFDIYRGKGKYYKNIHLSHDGLKGIGEFEYLNSKLTSNDIFFFPDSANIYTQSFVIKEITKGIEFPNVKNTDTYAHFEPYNDRLKVYRIKDDFDFYESQATFNGDLLMRPTGLTAKGIMSLDKAKVDANLFTYNATWFASDTAILRVFEEDGLLAFKANDLKTHIDLLNREGVFYSNGSDSYVELPANQYISYIDKLIWKIDEESLSLGEEVTRGKGSKFVSVHADQDSLNFFVRKASYSLKDYIIHANGVDSIIVADAIIFPDSGIVTIAKDALIETLYSAKILADDLTKYHIFTNATVDIGSAYNYKASADYTYIDGLNQEQQIFFKEITVDDNDTITIARGYITEDNLFHIDSKFDFKGIVHLLSDQKNLIFDGYFRINYDCALADKEWVKFRSKIDPEDINITLEKNIYNDTDDLLFTSLVMSFDSLNLYSTFLSQKDRSSLDVSMLNSSYNLSYNRNNSSYIVGGLDPVSNYYTLYDKTCTTKGKGIIDLNVDLGQFKLQSIGDIYYDMNSADTEIEGFLMLDFFFSEEAMQIMSEDLYGAPGNEIFEYDTSFAQNLATVVGREKAEVLLVDLEMEDDYSKFPDEMKYSMVLAKTKLKWDNNNKAYVGKGSFGVSSILDNQLSSIVDGYVIIEKGKKSDVFTLYLETELYDEYYFHYNNGVMQGYSTNPKFMAAINDVKEKKRVAENKKGASVYRYTFASEDVTDKFLKYVKKKY